MSFRYARLDVKVKHFFHGGMAMSCKSHTRTHAKTMNRYLRVCFMCFRLREADRTLVFFLKHI